MKKKDINSLDVVLMVYSMTDSPRYDKGCVKSFIPKMSKTSEHTQSPYPIHPGVGTNHTILDFKFEQMNFGTQPECQCP
jgi:hypothetical protein